MNNNYRLQLRHGAEGKAFSTRDEVISYINGQLQYGKVELLPYEPILFFYGADDAKNTIIMVGLPEGKTQDGKSYFLVDTANLQEQINEGESEAKDLSEKLDEEIENRKAADKELQAAIDDEIKDRKAADEEEAKLRDEADKELGQLISDEAKNRENADANETKAREDADVAEEKARKEADEKETDERKAADEELQEFIDFSADDIQSLIESCGVIYNEKLAEGRVSYDPDSHDEVIRDAKSLSDAIDKVSKFATNLGQILKVSVEDTDTVDLTMEEDSKNGGSVIKAEVNIAGADGLSKKVFDNNIIGKTSEGIYAAASIEPSTTNPNVLIFKTSGYVDGQFKVDAYETEVPLTAYKGDNGKTTGVTVDVDADKNVISATLNLSSEESNILKLEDGEYVVEGLAKNIKYKDTTVANALTKHASRLDDIEDAIDGVKAVEVKGSETSTSTVSVEKSAKGDFTVSNDVKLSSDNSIVVANGGLSANVNASFKKGTSTLTINVGNTPYNVDLSELAVSVLKSATYDSVTEEIVLTFIVGDTEKTMRIPVGTLIHDVEVDDTDSIDLTLKSVSGGPNHISGEVRIDKTHSDNILTVTSNGLYVSQAYITNAVKEEAESRKEADTALQTKIDELSDLAKANKENISKEQARAEKAETANANAIAQEIKDARKAESDNAANIATNSESIKANSDAIADEIARAQKAEQANTDAISAEVNRAKDAEGVNANNISAEIDRAKEKENDLLASIGTNASAIKENKNAIDAEAKTARAAEKSNAEAITAEVTRAKDAEGVNAKVISEEAIRAKGVEDGLSTAIASEEKRATTAESTLGANIASEEKRAEKAEGELSAAITVAQTSVEGKVSAEKERAEKAEGELSAAITAEVTRAKAAEKTNSDNISAVATTANSNKENLAVEVGRATGAEKSLSDAITAEVTRAKEAEGKLSTAITSAQTAVEGNVANEKERAMTAEGNLSATITAAQTALEGKIATEGTRAKTEESSLSAAITAVQTALEEKVKEEETRAITAESGITTNAEGIAAINETISGKGGLNEKLTNEITRATEKDTDLSDAIKSETERAQSEESTIKKNIESISTAVGKIEIRKIADLEYALYVNDTKHGEFTIPKDQFLKSVNYDPTTKTLVFVFTTSDGDVTQNIAISDLVDTYTNGEGLSLNDNVFSVDFKSVASVSSVASVATDLSEEAARAKAEEALKANASDVYTKNEITTKLGDYATTAAVAAKANASDVYTKTEIGDTLLSYAKVSDVALKANASDVYTKNEITTKLGGYATTTAVALKADAENVYTKSAIDTTLGSYAKSADVYTKSEIDLTLGSYAKSENVYTKSAIDTTLGSYAKTSDVYTKSAIDTTLGDYAKSKDVYTKNDITTMLGNYATTTAVAAKADAENVYTKNEITTKLGDYATTAVVADKANVSDVYTKTEIGKLLSDYATTTAVAAKADASNVYTKNDITEKLNAYAKSADVTTGLATKLSTTDAENVYATKESLGKYATSESVSTIETNLSDRIEANEASIDNFGLTYNSATSELTYTDKNGSKTIYKLYSGSLVKDGTFDTKSNSIVLTIENAGAESKITIPVSELLSDISGRIATNENAIATINTSISKLAKNWTVKSSSTVDLTKDTSGENDSLTANVKVSTSNKQAIQSTTNGLYVSNDLEDYTVVYGETGTISAQTAISKLLSTITSVNSDLQSKITANANNITTLTKQVEENGSDISSIKTAVSTAQSNISDLKTDVATNKGSIDTLKTTVTNIQTSLTDYGKRISTAESNIASINSTLSNVQSSVTKMQNSIETLSKSITSLESTINTITGDGGKLATLTSDVSKLKDVTGSETYASTKTMSARLDVLENEGGASVKAEIANIENNLIGDKTNPVDGSIWAEINNMIDAGTF